MVVYMEKGRNLFFIMVEYCLFVQINNINLWGKYTQMATTKYAIFAGYDDKTYGGFKDIYDFAYTLDEAVCIFNKIFNGNLDSLYKNDGIKSYSHNLQGSNNTMTQPFDWVHIVDLHKKEIIVDSNNIIKSRL